MLSTTMTTKTFPLCFFNLAFLLLLALLGFSGVTGASLRDHRLRGAERDAAAPDEDMLKALAYIQSLRQTNNLQGHQQNSDFGENLQSMLRLASGPAQDEEPQASQKEEEGGEAEEDKSEELLQAVLSTLQQTEKAAAKPAPLRNGETAKAQSITPHKKLPLMFDEEEDEGEEGDDVDQGSPFKRTNENVEEKYTPQNLATLQSVFEELGKLTNPKRDNGEDEEEGDLFNARDVAYDEGDWDGQEEQAEEERHEVERALDYLEANEEASRDDLNDEGFAKRSADQDPDDEANLADFYLLKVLEQTEEEEQKRALEEQEEEEERTARRVAEYRNNIDPRLLYQLLQISQKYQIPPEDLIDMLRSGEVSSRKNLVKVTPVYSRKLYRKPDFYNRRLPERPKSPEEMRKERILKILGLSGDENSVQSPFRKQYKSSLSRLYTRPTWRTGESALLAKPQQRQQQQQQRIPTKLKDDYDDTENELATFLAARMLSKYPTYMKSKTGQKRDQEEEEEEGESQNQGASFERAVQDYFDQLDSERNEEKRQFEEDERGAEGFDNEAVMKLLSFVNPDTEDAKTTQ